MDWQLVRFRDDIDEDEPVQFYRARQEPSGRWLVEGAERWRYDTEELAFYGPFDPHAKALVECHPSEGLGNK